MKGKVLKVVEYNLSFGTNARMVNVFSVFKYLKNNNLYVIYADVGTQYNIVNYGGSHVKGDTILSIGCRNDDEEIIKEYIFKVVNGEDLNGFEVIPLDNIEGIELISSNHLELKADIIQQLIDKTMPKKEVVEDTGKRPKKKKKSGALLVLLFLLIAGGAAVYFLFPDILLGSGKTSKEVTCIKTSSDNSLNATLEDKKVLMFNYQDVLQRIDTTTVFRFSSEEAYESFINKGTMYKYMPEDETKGGFRSDQDNLTFTIMRKDEIDSSYTEATNYEDVILENKREGYTCEEKVLGE